MVPGLIALSIPVSEQQILRGNIQNYIWLPLTETQQQPQQHLH